MKIKKSPFGENSPPNKNTHTHWLPLVQRILEGKFPQKSPYFKGEKKVEMAKCFLKFLLFLLTCSSQNLAKSSCR